MTVQRARSTYTDNITALSNALTSGATDVTFGNWVANVVEGQREMLGFVTMRLDKDRETIRQFSACKNVTDALALQSRWMQEMMSDYTAESLKMLSIYAKAGRQQGGGDRREE